MTAPPQRTFTVRRIMVAADSSPHGRAAMEAAAALGAQLDAEVEGLFVEDVDILNVAELALGREVHVISGDVRVLDRTALENELRTEASRTRRALQAVAERQHVRSSFRVVRGRVEAEVIAAASAADLLVLGTASRSIRAHRIPGSTAIAAAERAPRSVLLLRPGCIIAGRALVAYDGTTGGAMALEAGVRLSGNRPGTLTVLLVAGTIEGVGELRSRVEEQLSARGVRPRFLETPTLSPGRICQLTKEAKADVFVLSADNPVLADKAHARLLAEAGCPILLVR